MMRVAVIGLGGIAKKGYLPILGAREGLELQFVSQSVETVRCLQDQYRVASGTTDLNQAIREKPQAAFVLSPSETHYEIILQLLEADIDVFVEKPATIQAAKTLELTELAERRERVFMVGFNRRFAPLHLKAKEMWGTRTTSIALFQKHRANASHPNLEHQFTDDTIHQIDILRFFCGEGRVVSTQYQEQNDRLYGAISTVELEQGGFAQVITSLRAGRWQESYTLHGENISVIIDAFLRVQLLEKEEDRRVEETYASSWKTTLEARGFTGQIEHFLECVQQRKEPITSGWEAWKTQRLLEDMIAAAKKSSSF